MKFDLKLQYQIFFFFYIGGNGVWTRAILVTGSDADH